MKQAFRAALEETFAADRLLRDNLLTRADIQQAAAVKACTHLEAALAALTAARDEAVA
jgi:hypothetical protein